MYTVFLWKQNCMTFRIKAYFYSLKKNANWGSASSFILYYNFLWNDTYNKALMCLVNYGLIVQKVPWIKLTGSLYFLQPDADL